jgi:ribonuclease HII
VDQPTLPSTLDPLGFLAGERLIGLDEVGRGALAADVVAACFLFLAAGDSISGLRDSKKLSPAQRGRLIPELEAKGAYGIGRCSPTEVDRLGIEAATQTAWRRALEVVQIPDGLRSTLILVVDGNRAGNFQGLGFKRVVCLPKADDLVKEVSAASVIAKEYRDAQLVKLGATFPQYGFEIHSGYGSPLHLEALKRHGPCEAHRKSFEPIRSMTLEKKTPRRSLF